MNSFKSFWQNHQGLIVTILGVALLPLSKKLGVQVDPLELYAAIGLIAAQVLGHHYKEATIAAAKIAAGVIDQLPVPAAEAQTVAVKLPSTPLIPPVIAPVTK